MSEPKTGYRLKFAYWLGVLLIACVTNFNLNEFGRPERFFPAGWRHEVVGICETHSDVCESVQIEDRRTWWSNKVGILVIARLGKEIQATEVVNGGLGGAGQLRNHVVVQVVPTSESSHHAGGHQLSAYGARLSP